MLRWRCFTLRGVSVHTTAQNVVEYGLIVATIAIVVLIATIAFGTEIRPWFQVLAGRVTTVGT
jgi:Flp pilus assembly pilin Flp